MIISKLIDKNHIKSTWIDDEDPMLQEWIDNGWKPLVETMTIAEPDEFEQVDYEYVETEDGILQTAVIAPNYQAEIAWNKKQLSDMDWKTTRNTIAEKAGMQVPIPWIELYNQTEAYRYKINELETKLK